MNDLARAMRRVEKKIVRAVAFRLYGLESYSRTSGESTPPAVCQRCKSAAIPTAPRGRLFKQLLKGANSIVGSGWSSLSKPSGDFLGKVAELPRPTSNRGLLEHERRESGFCEQTLCVKVTEVGSRRGTWVGAGSEPPPSKVPFKGVGWGGVGGMITFMFLCTHRHSNLIIFLAVEQRQAQLFHDQLRWGGVS